MLAYILIVISIAKDDSIGSKLYIFIFSLFCNDKNPLKTTKRFKKELYQNRHGCFSYKLKPYSHSQSLCSG